MTQAVPGPGEDEIVEDPGQRLESWKEIAAYLKRGVRTVQRWERTEGLPVHRHHHDKRGTVYAFCREIDAWRQTRDEGGVAAESEGGSVAGGQRSPFDSIGSWMSTMRRLVPRGPKKRMALRVVALILLLSA